MTEMTEYEMTKLCAQAMTYTLVENKEKTYVLCKDLTGGPHWTYNPIKDDWQAMLLLKTFNLCAISSSVEHNDPLWHVGSRLGRQFDAHSENLNHAIVECVAKYEKNKMNNKPRFRIELPEGDTRKVTVWYSHQDADGSWYLSVTINNPNGVKPMNDVRSVYVVGDKVRKVGGDYQFEGHVVAVFTKRSGTAIRLVVEDDRGVLHVYSEKNLERSG